MPYIKRGRRGSLIGTQKPLTTESVRYRVIGETETAELADFGQHKDLKEAILIAKIQAPNYLTCSVYSEDTNGILIKEEFSIRR